MEIDVGRLDPWLPQGNELHLRRAGSARPTIDTFSQRNGGYA